MYLLRVLLLFNELCSFSSDANLMDRTFKTSRRLENVSSDITFLEEGGREGKKGGGKGAKVVEEIRGRRVWGVERD